MTRQSRRLGDPEGKAALFSVAQTDEERSSTSVEELAHGAVVGKEALFSTRWIPGSVLVECRSCQEMSRIDLITLGKLAFPFSLWFPWRSHPHLMRCPECQKTAWLRIRWFG